MNSNRFLAQISLKKLIEIPVCNVNWHTFRYEYLNWSAFRHWYNYKVCFKRQSTIKRKSNSKRFSSRFCLWLVLTKLPNQTGWSNCHRNLYLLINVYTECTVSCWPDVCYWNISLIWLCWKMNLNDFIFYRFV